MKNPRTAAALGSVLVLWLCLIPRSAWALNEVPFIQSVSPAAYAPGTGVDVTLTITGTGFASNATVNFDGMPLTPDSVTSTKIVVTVPAASFAAAKTAGVTVKNPASPPIVGTSNIAAFPIALGTPSVSLTYSGTSFAVGYTLLVADFNRNGVPDLAVASRTNVYIYLGSGNGQYSLVATIGDLGFVLDMAGSDFNGDGIVDLAVVDAMFSSIKIYLGTGTGQFTLASSSVAGAYPASIGVGDFTRDGKLDLVVGAVTTNSVTVLEGVGDGTFNYLDSYTLPSPAPLAVSDFDQDGKLDVAVVSGGASTMTILMGDGTGKFTVGQQPAVNTFVTSILTGDFNKDGKQDLVINDTAGSKVETLLGDGSGRFSKVSSVLVHDDPLRLVKGDFNGDGFLDIGVMNQSDSGPVNNEVTVLLGDGAGHFTATVVKDFPNEGSRLTALAAGDFNQDALLDLVVCKTYSLEPVAFFMQPPAPEAGLLSQLSFGKINRDTTRSLPFTITNTGKADLVFTGATIGGATNGANFGVQLNTCASRVVPGGSCDLTVTFQPTRPGAASAMLTVSNNSGNGSQIVLLNGAAPSFGIAVLQPTSVDFGDQVVDTVSAPRTVQLTNTGEDDLLISTIGLSLFSTAFAISSKTCGSVLAAGATCEINVTFTPGQTGLRTGTLGVVDNSNGQPNSTQTVSLQGRGTVPNAILPRNLGFQPQRVGTSSAPMSVSLQNAGSGALTISSIATTGDYAQTNDCGTTLPGGRTCTISVTFTPTTTGSRTGQLIVTDNSNAVPGSIQRTDLIGFGSTPVASLSPASLAFDTQETGTNSASQPVTLRNASPVALAISSITVSGDYSQSNNCGTGLGPAGSCTINVVFTPTAAGERTGALTVTDDSGGVAGAVQTVSLTGSGVTTTPPFNACGTGRDLPAGQWTMFSLPCAVNTPGTVQSIFASLIAANYGSSWTVFERDETNNRYNKVNLNSTLVQGKGYWLKSTDAARFEVTGTPTPVTHPAGCTSSAGCYEIALTPPSTSNGLYSLAGNPFPANVDWSAVRVVADSGSAVTPSQAEASGDLSKSFWIWNGAGYDTFDDATPGMIGQLQTTYGMWVKVLDQTLGSIKLLVPAPETSPVASPTSIITGGKGKLKATEWYVRLTVEAVGENLKDSGNVLGHLNDSKPAFDSHDLAELAPSFTPYLTATFPHANWGAKAGDYASDFHKVKAGADAWSFVVRSDNPGRQVRVSWQVTGKAPTNMSLKDTKSGKVTAVKTGSYTFVMQGTERAFTWSVK